MGEAKLAKGRKDQTMSRVLRNIANSDALLLQQVTSCWSELAKSVKRRKFEKDKKVEEVMRLTGGSAAMLLAEVLQYWITDWKEAKAQRELDKLTAERAEQME